MEQQGFRDRTTRLRGARARPRAMASTATRVPNRPISMTMAVIALSKDEHREHDQQDQAVQTARRARRARETANGGDRNRDTDGGGQPGRP
jgi:hypothetical protein